jgi:hypothetical protein
MSILLVEISKAIIPVKSGGSMEMETWNNKVNKCELLFRQAALTSKWVRDFSVEHNNRPEAEVEKKAPKTEYKINSAQIPN